MARIRRIVKPSREGKNVTLSEARAVFRELSAGREIPTNKKAAAPAVSSVRKSARNAAKDALSASARSLKKAPDRLKKAAKAL